MYVCMIMYVKMHTFLQYYMQTYILACIRKHMHAQTDMDECVIMHAYGHTVHEIPILTYVTTFTEADACT